MLYKFNQNRGPKTEKSYSFEPIIQKANEMDTRAPDPFGQSIIKNHTAPPSLGSNPDP